MAFCLGVLMHIKTVFFVLQRAVISASAVAVMARWSVSIVEANILMYPKQGSETNIRSSVFSPHVGGVIRGIGETVSSVSSEMVNSMGLRNRSGIDNV